MMRLTRSTALVPTLAIVLSVPALAQTKVTPPKNSYTPAEDVQVGREAAAEVRRQLPMLDDDEVEGYVDRVGRRLVDHIPADLRQPAFQYSFDVVNLREINAFALPGGPMFLHRGMIEAAKTDGEVAGVMAHELAHVVLRHGTAQATKGQKFQIGAVVGQVLGAIVGGTEGEIISQGSQIGLGTWFLKYGREYERQADLLGAQIMARAGYDPRHMASMFRTIAQQGGNRGPEWLSSHPDPGNRHAAITREAETLRVADAANTSGSFQSARASLSRMSPAPTTEQVARAQKNGQRVPGAVGTSGRAGRVEPPSNSWRTHQPAEFLRVSVPSNWQQINGQGSVTYAPEGGYGQGSGFTHGVQVGVTQAQGGSLQQVTDALIQSFAQSNPQLRRRGGYSRATVGGRQGLVATLSNVSEATGQQEAVQLTTAQLSDGSVIFLVGVAPADEARDYRSTFDRIRQSVQIADRQR